MPTTITIYCRPTTSGATLRQIVGLPFPAASAGEFDVAQAIFGGEFGAPKEGDKIRDDAGAWWLVTSVGDLTDGSWSLTCSAAP